MNAPITHPASAKAEHPDFVTLADVLAVLRRHRAATMLSGIGAAIIVFILGVCRTPLFDAQATITLDLNGAAVAFGQQPTVDQNSWTFAHELLRTQRNILLSRDLLQAALKSGSFSTNQAYVGNSEALDRLRDRFTVSDSRDSWDLTLALRDEDPTRAESGLQAILDTFRSRNTDNEKIRSESSISFLENQVAEAKRKMEQSRESERGFQESMGLIVLDPEKSLSAQRLLAINAKAVMLSQQLTAINTLVSQIAANEAISDPEQRLNAMLGLELVNRHPTVIEQQRLLYELRAKQAELGQKYLEQHPRMIELHSEITVKVAQLQESVTAIRNGILADRTKLATQLLSLKEDKAKAEAEFNEYRLNLFRLQTLTQETRANGELYEHLLKRLGEERIAQHLDKQQLSVTDSPIASSQPANIHIALTVLAALVGGVIVGIICPLALEYVGKRANSADDIQAMIGKPVLGYLPFVPDLPVFGAHGNPNFPPALTEAVRSLRAALRIRKPRRDVGECLMITSCDPGDGKSTVSVRLAMSMAQSGQRVLLVDGDLHNPTLHIQLEQNCEQGLSLLLAGEPGISPAETTYANLSFMDAGEVPAQTGDLLNSHCLREWLLQCRQQFDAIIIDTPPLSRFADALMVGECADDILLVVREGATRTDSMVRSQQLLLPLMEKLTGIVLIRRAETLGNMTLPRNLSLAFRAPMRPPAPTLRMPTKASPL